MRFLKYLINLFSKKQETISNDCELIDPYLGFKSIPEGVRTRRLAESQDEYQNLDIIDAPFEMPDGRQVNQMTCYLEISEEQRKRIFEGSTLSVKILGEVFQPIMVKLEEIPELNDN